MKWLISGHEYYYTEVMEYHHGQTDFRIIVSDNEKYLGRVEYSKFGNIIQVDWIEIEKPCRRQGIATRLINQLKKDNPGIEIKFSLATQKGWAFIQSL